MDFTNIFVILFTTGTVFDFVLNQFLEFTDYSSRKKNGTKVPAEIKGLIDEATLKKTCSYENAKYFMWIPRAALMLILDFVLVFCGFYVQLFNFFWSATNNIYLTAIAFVFLSSIPSDLLELPFELADEFSIEKKFGFSNMSFKMWICDRIKSLAVNLIVSVPLLCAACALLSHAGSWWWFLLGTIFVVLSLGMSFVYPVWIAPLFNKFTPLEDAELKQRIEKLFEQNGFRTSGVFIMDASKRSRHSNAYFTGFGKTKRIVLYDTLVEQLTAPQIEAVLAHELGHYKHRHIIKRMCVSIPLVYAVLFAASIIVRKTCLYTGFGFEPATDSNGNVGSYIQIVGFFLLNLSLGGFSKLQSLVANTFSRRDEFEADAFSAKICHSGRPLAEALVKLNKENLTELTPPRIYCMFNYSHPPLLERIRAVEAAEEKAESKN